MLAVHLTAFSRSESFYFMFSEFKSFTWLPAPLTYSYTKQYGGQLNVRRVGRGGKVKWQSGKT